MRPRIRVGSRNHCRTLLIALAAAAGASIVSVAVAGNPVSWSSATSGSWTDASKWEPTVVPNNGVPAGAAYDALIAAPGSAYSIGIGSDISIDDLILNSSAASLNQTAGQLLINGSYSLQAGTHTISGGTLSASTLSIGINGTLRLTNGTIRNTRIETSFASSAQLGGGTLDNVTLAGDAFLNQGTVNFRNGLALAGANLTLQGSSPTLRASGAGTIGGSGQILLGALSNSNFITADSAAGSSLSIGSSIAIRTAASGGQIGNAAQPLTNAGTISCETSAANLIFTGSNWINNGTLAVSAGTLTLAGTTTSANLGTIVHSGGTLVFAGTFDNNAATLNLNPLGSVSFNGATINGGTLSNLPGAAEVKFVNFITLGSVTLGTDVTANGVNINFHDGLTLNSNLHLRLDSNLTGSGTQSIAGNGTIILEDLPLSSNYGASLTGADAIGPGITIRTGTSANTFNQGLTIKVPSLHGLISAQTSGLSITLSNGTWTNTGTLSVSAGSMTLLNSWTNLGAIVGSGGTLGIGGLWTNSGSITCNHTYIPLGGTPGQIGTFIVSNGTIDVTAGYTTQQLRAINATSTSFGVGPGGTLTNTNDTLQLDAFGGDFRLNGGTFVGGSVGTSGPYKLTALVNSTLKAVTLNAPMAISSTSFINTTDLVNNSTITAGTTSASGGGIDLSGKWTNNGTINVTRGTFRIRGNPLNLGTISVGSSTFDIWTNLTTAQVRNMSRAGNFFELDSGVLDNTADTLQVAAGNWALYDGTVRGGTITSTGGTLSIARSSTTGLPAATILDGVNLALNTSVTSDAAPTILNGLTLTNSRLTLGATPFGAGSIVFSATQSIGGNGSIVLDGDRGELAGLLVASGTLTVGPGISIIGGNSGGFVGSTTGALLNQGTVSAATSAKSITVRGSSITNSGTFEARNGGTLIVSAGSLTNLSAGALTGGIWNAYAGSTMSFGSSTVTTSAADVRLTGVGSAFPAVNSLQHNIGTFTVTSGRSFNTVGDFTNDGLVRAGPGSLFAVNGTLTNNGTIDVGGGLAIDYSGTSPLPALQAQIASGYAGGFWTGPGINSSAAAAIAGNPAQIHKTSIGLAEAADLFSSFPATFMGQEIDSTTVLARYVYLGDANLDGTVNSLDFIALASHFDAADGKWAHGDFNGDTFSNALDFSLLATNYGQTVPMQEGVLSPSLSTVLPEPIAISGLLLLLQTLRHRSLASARRRRR